MSIKLFKTKDDSVTSKYNKEELNAGWSEVLSGSDAARASMMAPDVETFNSYYESGSLDYGLSDDWNDDWNDNCDVSNIN